MISLSYIRRRYAYTLHLENGYCTSNILPLLLLPSCKRLLYIDSYKLLDHYPVEYSTWSYSFLLTRSFRQFRSISSSCRRLYSY